MILVYFDLGVGPHAFKRLIGSLREEPLLQNYPLKIVDHQFLQNEEDWEKKTTLLIFPGGRDVPYHNLLKGVANQRIANYVQQGGSYLGICAGGYYGASFIEFEKGGQLEICASRELQFYPGKAVGPAYGNGQFCYQSDKGARASLISWIGGECHIYFNGGCFFEHPENYPNVEVMARYQDLEKQPAAVVFCKIGKGKAVLCGIHPEYGASALHKSHSYFQEIQSQLRAHEKERLLFWRFLLASLIP